jgi:biotin carboxylase
MTIFILGASVMQIPAFRAAKELGWTVAAADGNAAAIGVSLADHFVHVDLNDRDGLVAAARRIRNAIGLDGVFTAGTDFSLSVSRIAEKLGLPGIPYEAALRASDKQKMREAFAAAGVSSPRFAVLGADTSPAAAIRAAADLAYPLVVKPVDNMGARGCRAARDSYELASALRDALPFSRSGRVIIEEFVDGPEFSVDAIVRDGEILVRGLADRHIAFVPFFVELGHTIPTAFPPAVQAKALEAFASGVRAIGIENGVAKGDIKYSIDRGVGVVGEIAARLSGGYMSGWTYPYASGIEVTREALLAAVGMPPESPKADRGWVSAERAYISIPGKVRSVIGSVEAERLPYVKQIFGRVSPGERVVFPSNNVEKCGNVISLAPDWIQAVQAAEAGARLHVVRLEPCDDATEAFLAGAGRIANPDGSTWPPEAFALEAKVASALLAMPECGSAGEERESAVSVLPFSLESRVLGLDWSGRTYSASADLAMEMGGAYRGDRGRVVLAGRFWRALAIGGLQAALYVLDCARREAG